MRNGSSVSTKDWERRMPRMTSFVRLLVKETEKMVSFFFKGSEEFMGEDEEERSIYLDKPMLDKEMEEGQVPEGLSYALASMQGWRAQMEDAHTCVTEMPGELADWCFFAVYDGHAGSTVAQYCSRHLLTHILATGKVTADGDPEKVKEGIRDGFLSIDSCMHDLTRQEKWENSGSTAVAVMISPRHIYFINCGDSRAVLCRDGHVCFYTEDHKPFNPREQERIQNAGGTVFLQRVNGSLAVSRALGDFDFKDVEWRLPTEQLVSPEPEVYEVERSAEDEFLVLACDGVWDAVDNEELCAFIRSRLQISSDLKDICGQVVDTCLYKGSRDNISVLLIGFPGAPQVSPEALQQEEELEEVISNKVAEIFDDHTGTEVPGLVSVIKHLSAELIPGLPPGGGLASKRDFIFSSYYKLREERTRDILKDSVVNLMVSTESS
ncbi:protein phosphatase, Mg2+/Mn2+ dependent, 1Na (putative) isoform X1 [Erpetoichthys calabaricus]|uniref:protein phosphatase, Mg2+/Mn2+ dependent, 1Na (putative) isoform X1 n=1 Tax=Erpetoichthys calabaricus TaxID=27687 RepID=UPI002233EE38|nr:protein phosphatase, Mg2+/Mn2+ dependent, 1Na (putative) isoform X1 [Erpetoichthys calabaricus]